MSKPEGKPEAANEPAPVLLGKGELLTRGRPLPTEDVRLEGGAAVRVRTLCVAHRDDYLKVASGERKVACGPTAYLVVLCAVDGEGKRIFEDKDLGDVGQLNPGDIDRIFKVALKLNGLAASSVDDAEKN